MSLILSLAIAGAAFVADGGTDARMQRGRGYSVLPGTEYVPPQVDCVFADDPSLAVFIYFVPEGAKQVLEKTLTGRLEIRGNLEYGEARFDVANPRDFFDYNVLASGSPKTVVITRRGDHYRFEAWGIYRTLGSHLVSIDLSGTSRDGSFVETYATDAAGRPTKPLRVFALDCSLFLDPLKGPTP